MVRKFLTTLLEPRDAETINQHRIEVLAKYPDCMIVRCNDSTRDALVAHALAREE